MAAVPVAPQAKLTRPSQGKLRTWLNSRREAERELTAMRIVLAGGRSLSGPDAADGSRAVSALLDLPWRRLRSRPSKQTARQLTSNRKSGKARTQHVSQS